MDIKQINPALLNAFSPYLVDEARRAVAELPPERVVAFGAVTPEHQTCAAIAAARMDGVVTVFSLYVDPAVRRRGVASQLLVHVLEDAQGAPVDALWTAPAEDCAALAAFFSAHGFSVEQSEETLYRFTCADLRSAPVVRHAFSPDYRPPDNIVPFGTLSPEELAELNDDVSIDPRLRPNAAAERLAPEMSFCCRYGGRIADYLLCGWEGERNVTVLSAVTRRGGSPAVFMQLAAAAVRAAHMLLGDDFSVWLDAIDERTKTLATVYAGGQLTAWQVGSATRVQ